VGYYWDGSANHGFILNYGNGENPPAPTPFDYSGSAFTKLLGINNNGLILGKSDSGYFLYDENSRLYVDFTIGLQQGDVVSGLNDNADLAGGAFSAQNCVDGLVFYTGLTP
jgi:hypothetical protein